MPDLEAAFPIITTKLYRPSVTADYINREVLDASLEAGLQLPLTVVSAPAGYGKSTLISHWLGARDTPSAWFSLQESDSDTRVFLTYFITALRQVVGQACEKTLKVIEAENLPPIPVIVALLSNDIDELETRVILVLDDYHRIKEPAIHEILDRLLEFPPRKLGLVIITRRDPFLSLSKLRARHLLHEIRMVDLKLSMDETLAFVENTTGDRIESANIKRLQETMEGWFVGIRLAVLAMKHHEDTEIFLERFGANAQSLKQYLFGEVLSGLSPRLRECLLNSSILHRFNASLCEAILELDDCDGEGPASGMEFIEALEESGLFCIALDERHEWYRYHHLFRDLLNQQLEVLQSKNKIFGLHQRASQWFRESGHFEEAIEHALAGCDVDSAATIIGEVRHELMNRDQWHRLDRWLKLFGQRTVEDQPQLLLLRCWLAMNYWYRIDLVARDIGLASTLLERCVIDSEEGRQLKEELSAIRSALSYWTLVPEESVALSRQVIQNTPAEHECVRSTALLMQAGAHQLLGESSQAERLLMDYLEEGRFKNPSSRARLLQGLCFVCWIDVNPPKLRRSADGLLEIGLVSGQSWSFSYARYFLGLYHYERNELEQAIDQLDVIAGDPYRYPIQNVANCSYLLSLSYQAKGLHDRAREVADSIMKLTFESGNRMFIDLTEAFLADLELRQGRTARAEQWFGAYSVPGPHAITRPFHGELIAVRVIMSRNTLESRTEAARRLDALHGLLQQINQRRMMIDVLGMSALVAEAEGDVSTADAYLKEAVRLGKPGQLIRPLADLGSALVKPLNRLNLDKEALQYVGRIISALLDVESKPGVQMGDLSVPKILSRRELEVLQLFARNLTNPEIAEQLFISHGTVKRHAQNIYKKLSVSSRREAVSKAAGMGLLIKA